MYVIFILSSFNNKSKNSWWNLPEDPPKDLEASQLISWFGLCWKWIHLSCGCVWSMMIDLLVEMTWLWLGSFDRLVMSALIVAGNNWDVWCLDDDDDTFFIEIRKGRGVGWGRSSLCLGVCRFTSVRLQVLNTQLVRVKGYMWLDRIVYWWSYRPGFAPSWTGLH